VKNKIIIIGGIGPQASLELHQRLIDTAVARGAKDGSDFPNIVHLSIPIPDFIDGIGFAKALEMIKASLDCLYPWQRRSVYTGLQYCTQTIA